MSKGTVTGQVTVISDGTTFFPILQCTIGDLYQSYKGDPASPTNVSPNFETIESKPLIVFQAFSAQEATGSTYNLANATANGTLIILLFLSMRMAYQQQPSME